VPTSPSAATHLALAEQVDLLTGDDAWHTRRVPRLGLGRLMMSDGPAGVRGSMATGATGALFPCATALGASWDVGLAREIGQALAEEAGTKGASVVLAPGLNIQRVPLGGRNFEYLAEDPMLVGHLGAAVVRGLQSAGVGACVKHFVGNEQEQDKYVAPVSVSERALREVYLRPFEHVLRTEDPWLLMAAYNGVGATTMTANARLLRGVLREEWGWTGVVVSDWLAVTDTVGAILGGTDLEMPGPGRWYGELLLAAVQDGRVPAALVAEAADRVLRLLRRAGRYGDPAEPVERAVDRPEHRELARRAAVAGTVLLRNEGALLPLDLAGVRRVAVVGPGAEPGMVCGGGSSALLPHRLVTPLAGLRDALGAAVEVVHVPGCMVDPGTAAPDPRLLAPSGWRQELWAAEQPEGEPYAVSMVAMAGGVWIATVAGGVGTATFCARWSTVLTPDAGGSWTAAVATPDRARLLIDGQLVVDAGEVQDWLDPFAPGRHERTGTIELRAGVPVEVVVELSRADAGALAVLRVGLAGPLPDDSELVAAVQAAAAADVAVVCVGTGMQWECEGQDRGSLSLPGRQDELVRRVLAAQPRTVVVLAVGAPVVADWLSFAPAVVLPWFAGQAAGDALADVLLGRGCPGGRLPHTWPRSFADCCAADTYPSREGVMAYDEGVLVGHRWYDARGVEPLFPFGHGLGYDEVQWTAVDGAAVAPAAAPLELTVTLANPAPREVSEVVQVYAARRPLPPGAAPAQLAGFRAVHLLAGERRQVTVTLDPLSWSRWDDTDGWVADPGPLQLQVCASSRDRRLSHHVELQP